MHSFKNEEGRTSSLVSDENSEWRKRPVNVMKVFKSLYSQLTKGGADLTRISMPSEIHHPFSALEVLAYRELANISALYELNNNPEDSLQRFLCVARWIVSFLPKEKMEKKPYNPTIGEEHICWIEHSDNDWTELFVEQVSHHPPLTALFLRNQNQKISLLSSLDAEVSFSGNSVTILNSGEVTILTAHEKYHMTRHVPSLIIRRIIFGEKYYVWSGPLTLECAESGYKLTLNFSEKNENTNLIKGQITKEGNIVFEIRGNVGREIFYWKPEEGEKKKKELYKFCTGIILPDISYPPANSLVPNNSLRQWREVTEAIVKNDMATADIAKKKIEQLQRVREKKREQEGEEYEGTYFEAKVVNDKKIWEAKENIRINKEYLEELKERVKREEKRINHEEAEFEETNIIENEQKLKEEKEQNEDIKVELKERKQKEEKTDDLTEEKKEHKEDKKEKKEENKSEKKSESFIHSIKKKSRSGELKKENLSDSPKQEIDREHPDENCIIS